MVCVPLCFPLLTEHICVILPDLKVPGQPSLALESLHKQLHKVLAGLFWWKKKRRKKVFMFSVIKGKGLKRSDERSWKQSLTVW